MLSGGRPYFIDLGSFSYGNPVIDLVEFFMVCFVADEKISLEQYHVSQSLAQAFFTSFLCHYFGISTEEEIAEKMKMLSHFTPLQIAHMAEGHMDDSAWNAIQLQLLKLMQDE